MDIGQPEVAAGIAIGQAGMIDSQSMQNGRVVVVHVARICGDLSAVFIGFTPDGQSVVEAKRDGTIRVWDVASGKDDVEDGVAPVPYEKVPKNFYGRAHTALTSDNNLLLSISRTA